MFIYKLIGGPDDGETITLHGRITDRWYNIPKPYTAKVNYLTYEVCGFELIFQEGQDYEKYIYKYHGGPNDGETFTTVTKISYRLFWVAKPATIPLPATTPLPPDAKIEALAYEVHGFNLIFQEWQDYERK